MGVCEWSGWMVWTLGGRGRDKLTQGFGGEGLERGHEDQSRIRRWRVRWRIYGDADCPCAICLLGWIPLVVNACVKQDICGVRKIFDVLALCEPHSDTFTQLLSSSMH